MDNSTFTNTPLLVDLDGSLLKSDSLHEMALLFISQHPWKFFLLFIWLLSGKTTLKKNLYANTSLNVQSLPYNQDAITFLDARHRQGQKIILCTATWYELAEDIATQFDFIDEVIATTDGHNLAGDRKAEEAVSRFGESGFDYLGNASVDLKVWQHARKAVVVGSDQLCSKAEKLCSVDHHIPNQKLTLKSLLKAIRIHQWAKNALLFIPLITAHKFTEPSNVLVILVAFIAFSFCASATYLLNDMFDLESDRKHPKKRFRPLACANMSIVQGIIIGSAMLIVAFILGAMINLYFLLTLAIYTLLTVLYSFKLKSLQTIDVITLASLFTIRVIAGGAAITIGISFWLLSFSMFIFLSLAMVKRVSELVRLESEKTSQIEKASGRGYFTSDIIILQSLGGSAGFLSVLVFALYINSPQVIELYRHPEILWLLCPVIGYWIMRIWMYTARGEMNEDPISFALTDKNSWIMALFIGVVISIASYWSF